MKTTTPAETGLRILDVSASGRYEGSRTRASSQAVIADLTEGEPIARITRRDLAEGIPFVDAEWIAANFTPAEERTESHRETLQYSDKLVAELQDADTLVIGAPVYNFSIPAALKAWIDMVARARLTFRYTENGPVGLLTGKTAYLVVASGGVKIGSDKDFATPYLRHALSFIGIDDVKTIEAA